MTLPLTVQWILGAVTVAFGAATVALAVIAIRLTAKSKHFAEESKRLSEWQRHDQELTNFKQLLEQRIGYAHSFVSPQDLALVVAQLPPSPGELPADRQARRERRALASEAHASTVYEFESLVFTWQPDEQWSLEIMWGSYASSKQAFTEASRKYALHVGTPPDDLAPDAAIWDAGPRHLVVTRRTEDGEEG